MKAPAKPAKGFTTVNACNATNSRKATAPTRAGSPRRAHLVRGPRTAHR